MDYIHGAITTTCALTVLFRILQYGNIAASANAVEIRFGFLGIFVFAISWLGCDQAEPYHWALGVLDTTEALLIAQYFNLLGLFPQTPREGHPNPGWAVAIFGVALLLQMLWRKLAGLRLDPEHWDYRFLVIAAAGGACFATGWNQLLFLSTAAGLVVGYIRAGLNQPPSEPEEHPQEVLAVV